MPATDAAAADRAAGHLDGFVRSLGEAGVGVSMPKRIDFLRALEISSRPRTSTGSTGSHA